MSEVGYMAHRQKMLHTPDLKAIQKIVPMDVSVSGTIDQKTHLKKIRGALAPLAPWIRLWRFCIKC